MRNPTGFIPLIVGMVIGTIVSMTEAASAAPASCPDDPKLARLVAASDLILVGRMRVATQRLVEEARKPSPDYLDIPIQVDGVIKGDDAGTATVRFYPKDASYRPSNDAVLGLVDAPAILFLTRIDQGQAGLYFAGSQPEALRAATEQALGAARAESSRQTQIIRSWRPDSSLARFDEVRALITRLGQVSGTEQQRVFEQLEALGHAAVPAIIAQMDDRRPLRTQAISLVNHASNAFEGVRHYSPDQVVDGLDAILNQMTGAGFGSIVNGGSDRQRDAAVAGWRIYAADLPCHERQ